MCSTPRRSVGSKAGSPHEERLDEYLSDGYTHIATSEYIRARYETEPSFYSALEETGTLVFGTEDCRERPPYRLDNMYTPLIRSRSAATSIKSQKVDASGISRSRVRTRARPLEGGASSCSNVSRTGA